MTLSASAKAHLASIEITGPAKAFPASKYAINTKSGLVFFEVKAWKKTPTVTVHYVRRLIGHPGDWLRTKPTPQQQTWLLEQLQIQTPQALAKLFAEEHKVCAKCGSPLSDELSLARGLGPICYEAF